MFDFLVMVVSFCTIFLIQILVWKRLLLIVAYVICPSSPTQVPTYPKFCGRKMQTNHNNRNPDSGAILIIIEVTFSLMGTWIVCLWYFSRYPKSIEIYEEIARQSMNNNLLKYGVKGHLLNAGLCQLCKGDVVAITNALERYQVWIWPYFSISTFYLLSHPTILMSHLLYQELDPTFSGTREYRFLAVSFKLLLYKFCIIIQGLDSSIYIYISRAVVLNG